MPPKCRVCGKYHMGFCKEVKMYAKIADGNVEIKSLWDCFRWVWAVWHRNRKVRKRTVIHWSVDEELKLGDWPEVALNTLIESDLSKLTK